MLLCQVELRSLEDVENQPTYYIVGRYGFDPELQVGEDIWINWQVARQNLEIEATVTSRRKEIYVDGQGVALTMSEADKAKFSAIYPDGIQALMEGASLFLVRIFVEAKDRNVLFQIQAAIANSKNLLDGQKRLPDSMPS
ncbi:MAG: hypothetical protein AAFQ95_04500 [Cyanobacteria bacterium J06621_3]